MIKFLLISISFITFLFGELTLDEGMSKIDNFSMQYYYDQSKKLDINKIDKIQFTQDINNKFSLGYIKGNSWFKLRLKNESQNEDFVLHFAEAFYENINLFEDTQDSWKIKQSGLAQWTDLLEVSIPLYILFLVLFSNTFFNTKKYLPFVAKIFKLFIIVLSFLILFTIIDYDTWFEITIQIVTPFAPLLIIVPVYVLLQGNMEMKYYIIGIIIYVISTIMLSLMTGGVIENSDFNHYFFVVGSYIEILFFSFILANRFHTIQKEKIEIQKELLAITNQNEQKLQKK
jgi:hypothetical protein